MKFPLYAVVQVKNAREKEHLQIVNYQPGKRSGVYGCRVIEQGQNPPVKLPGVISFEAGQLETVKMSERDTMAENLFKKCKLKELKKELELWHLEFSVKAKKDDLARILACSRVYTNLQGAHSTWDTSYGELDGDDTKVEESREGQKRAADDSKDAEDMTKEDKKRQRVESEDEDEDDDYNEDDDVEDDNEDDSSQDEDDQKEKDEEDVKQKDAQVMKDHNMLWSGRQFLSVVSCAQRTMEAMDGNQFLNISQLLKLCGMDGSVSDNAEQFMALQARKKQLARVYGQVKVEHVNHGCFNLENGLNEVVEVNQFLDIDVNAVPKILAELGEDEIITHDTK